MAIVNIETMIENCAHPLSGAIELYDPLMELVGDARFVLLGEASHGTHEFYRERAEITKRLIAEKGFTAVAIEADWPDAYRINRYVRGESDDAEAIDALSDLKRFPAWMWRNADVLDFVGWLRAYNDALSENATKVGFYGLDLYSLHASIEAVLKYLDQVDSEAAARARYRYSCFEDFGEDAQAYGYATGFGISRSCEEEVVSQLVEMRQRASELSKRNDRLPTDEFFFAEQNARVIKNAEEYYRSLFRGRASSWNVRDWHMAETFEALVKHMNQGPRPAKIVVWEHNSHLGDARATEMAQRGEINAGQLIRERYGGEAILVGFTTYSGTVTAASNWGGPAERKRVRPALPDSYEALFHEAGYSRFLLILRDDNLAAMNLRPSRLERAIGVIYRPESERVSHYFNACLPEQFDAVLHFDQTRAVEPIDRVAGWWDEDLPETYPSGI